MQSSNSASKIPVIVNPLRLEGLLFLSSITIVFERESCHPVGFLENKKDTP